MTAKYFESNGFFRTRNSGGGFKVVRKRSFATFNLYCVLCLSCSMPLSLNILSYNLYVYVAESLSLPISLYLFLS